jgi:hypothetical protein
VWIAAGYRLRDKTTIKKKKLLTSLTTHRQNKKSTKSRKLNWFMGEWGRKKKKKVLCNIIVLFALHPR